MKNFKHFLLTVLVAFVSSVSAFAYDFEVDGIYYTILSKQEKTCEVSRCPGEYKYSGEVNIPSTVTLNFKKYTVTEIGDSAFYDCPGLTLTIPNSVTKIGENAFRDCI